MPKAYSEAERGAVRQRLLAAGRKLINGRGVRHLTVDDLVREAGISKGGFYGFFPSREDFILSVFESWEDQYRTEFLQRLDDAALPPAERWEAFFNGMFGLMEKEPGLAQMRSADIELLMLRLPPERLAAHQARDAEVLGAAMARWLAQGWVSPEAAGLLPGLVAALFSMGLHRHEFGEADFAATSRFLSRALAFQMVGPGAADARRGT